MADDEAALSNMNEGRTGRQRSASAGSRRDKTQSPARRSAIPAQVH